MRKKQTTPYNLERKVFFILLGALILLFSAYIYFVSASIVHVIVRKEIDREKAALGSRISELEAEFIAVKHSVDDTVVAAHGFVPEVPKKMYIKKAPASLVLVREP